MKIVLTRDDVERILIDYILQDYSHTLDVHQPSDIKFNYWNLPYGDLIFEKKIIQEVKLEDVTDMTATEVLKAKGEKDGQ